MKVVDLKAFAPHGVTGRLASDITRNFLIGLRESNPAILDMFAERDKLPYRDLLPWSGEFAGKYITGAYYIYMIIRDEALRDYIEKFIAEVLTYQDADGYLGCYSKECRLTGAFSNNPTKSGETWDAWAHYHLMFGLLKWYDVNGDESYMDAVRRIADLFISTFFNESSGGKRLVDIGWAEMNLAPYHVFAILASKTGDKRYLDFAKQIEADIADERAGNYLNCAENAIEYYQCPKPRWESMHIIAGIAEMYRATGEKRYLDDALQIFDSILRTDIHNTGAFSTNEQAVGSPFREGAIETCCVIAYNALAADLYLLTGRSDIIDFLELSHYNAVLGYYNPTGRWSTYTTPMEGYKCSNYHIINFQCRPGSPELNCCSVNAPRGVGEMSEWMLTEQGDTIYINAYEACSAASDSLSIEIDSVYPVPGDINITVSTAEPKQIALRIPAWSVKTSLTVNGNVIKANAGGYVLLDKRVWDNEKITLKLDFSVHFTDGHEQYEGKRSIYYGPVLYGCDSSLVDMPVGNLPAISASELKSVLPSQQADGRITVALSNGVTLGDFRMLGYTGSYFRTFLEIEN